MNSSVVFDTAFILERFPDGLEDSRLLEIAELAGEYRTGPTREAWQSAFRLDSIMRRADADNVWGAVEDAIAQPLDQARQRQALRRARRHEFDSAIGADRTSRAQKPAATHAPPGAGSAKCGRKRDIGY